ncbi:EamA family transporter [Ornithinimicrobium cerasi]|uniref:Inner membrane transporter RhtA n=1 Tax=Ornithinimicrobium cerasi TaxID=2248773 RepID=A0A285VKC5_9MICO|nr:EamA family transporter [Ornithinimicrobium cerasi]SOC54532.1 inner membrane transporter RhtA [Ornithinimicrobium cerasi]
MTDLATPERRLPHPVVLVLVAVVSVQFGGALAATLLPLVGVFGSVALRLALSGLLLWVVVRPRVRGRSRQDWLVVSLFAVALTAMNLTFYGSLTRLPIGVAVTIEFLGPLALAAVLSRRPRDLLAVASALVGVMLISGAVGTPWAELDLVGIALAGTAGVCWAAYIVLSRRTGARFERLDGIALCLAIGAVLAVPAGLLTAGSALWEPEALLRGLGIALLSSAIPYSLELLALRRLTAGTFGVLLSLEPAAAALAGLLVLGQVLSVVQLVGMLLVLIASVVVLGRPSGSGAAQGADPGDGGHPVPDTPA